ncbi:SDR family oxidoreductase [Aristophania vespae]|uniref:SDR family oxidoreductase n=1 Tax=Aristophania vespae TaxID=2697033 RepID=A0A6P1NG40_9PROT|nr:SDR family oxidoreductase [Aristophania vespae]QHI96223.1 SDR family oxidoreductase [Aristophania vespae]
MAAIKTALITGGTSGIGLAIARKLASQNCNIILVGSRPSKDYSEAVQIVSKVAQTQAGSPWVKSYGVDVTKEADVTALMKVLQADNITLDIVVHSAGVFFDTPITDESSEAFDRMIAINVNGMWNIIRSALPLVKKGSENQPGGKIVALSSICSFFSFATYSGYCASKAAVTALTKSLALELGPMGININAVEPGRVETPMHDQLINDPAQAEILKSIASSNPSRRAFSSPDDIANVVAFLTSDAAQAMHGAAIVIDEGMSLGLGA